MAHKAWEDVDGHGRAAEQGGLYSESRPSPHSSGPWNRNHQLLGDTRTSGHKTTLCFVSDNPEPAGQSGSLLLVLSECLYNPTDNRKSANLIYGLPLFFFFRIDLQCGLKRVGGVFSRFQEFSGQPEPQWIHRGRPVQSRGHSCTLSEDLWFHVLAVIRKFPPTHRQVRPLSQSLRGHVKRCFHLQHSSPFVARPDSQPSAVSSFFRQQP